MKTTISHFKEVCENLSRFASVRENAKEPQDRIVVQVWDGVLKFIAGSEHSTIVVMVCEADPSIKAMMVVPARPLLQGAKALRGRGEVTFEVGERFRVVNPAGGELDLKPLHGERPEFVRPVEGVALLTHVQQGFLPEASKFLTAHAGRLGSMDYIWLTHGSLRAFDQHRMASIPLHMETSTFLMDKDFIEAWRGFDGEADIIVTEETLEVRTKDYVAVTKALRHPSEWEGPELSYRNRVCFSVDRDVLVQGVRSVSHSDEHHRVRLVQPQNGDHMRVESYTGEAKVSVATLFSTPSQMRLDGDLLEKSAGSYPKGSLVFSKTENDLVVIQHAQRDWLLWMAPVL